MPRQLRTGACLLVAVTALLLAPSPSVAAPPIPQRSADVQRSVDTARAAYEAARVRVAALSAQSARLAASAGIAEAEAERLHEAVAEDDGGFVSAVGDLLGTGPSDLDLAAEAAANAELARDLADMLAGSLVEAIDATEQARLAWERAERRRERVEAAWTAEEAAAAAIRRSEFQPAYAVEDAAQDRRNHRAQHSWHGHLRALARNAVVPPPAAELADPTTVPAPLEPVRDSRNELSPGVAELDPPGRRAVTVPPAETVRAVSEAFRRVGLPQVPGAIDPTTYACGGLVANAWTPVSLPADAAGQWEQLHAVPKSSVQLGDVVVLGSRADGIAGTGVYVGRNQAVLADPVTGVAAVRPLTGDVLGVRRPGVPTAGHRASAPAGGVCGTAADAGEADTGGALDLPMTPGSYDLTAGFGVAGHLWSSGVHTGLDFSAPVGTPVVAAGSGTVTVEHPDWAGILVRIDHGGGVETWYAHLSGADVATGDVVDAGDPVGLVGSRGNSTGSHLHFEVQLDGAPYDPAQVLALPELPRPTYENGDLPLDALCPATPDGLQLLRCDAAVAFRLLGAAYAEAFGTDLCVTDSYRSRSGQERVFAAKPALAAVPGTSVHGLGLAVDLCGGVERFGTAENDWLLAEGPSYGWQHPAWAAAGGSRPEPWHFEYVDGTLA